MSEVLIRQSDVIEAIHNYWKEQINKLPVVECEYGEVITEDCWKLLKHNKELSALIKAIPSADRPQEWVPCRERMPSEQGQYLVTFPLCNGEPWVYILSFNKGKFYETDDEWGNVEYDDVTAWMPLPKPWKGADDE